ncbi:MAG: GFA family protein [Caulobacteraceae bacterium]
MNDWKLPWSASCLCGQVKMRVTAPPLVSAACHCKGCQKLTGGAYSLTLMIPPGGFEVIEGEPVLGALHRAESQHHYCPHCKSWLFTTAPALQGVTNFRSTMLDDATWVVPFVESNVTEKLPGVVTGAKRSFDGFPPPSEYGRLMQEYAQEGARPR